MKIYLCRHGQTDWNANKILQGRMQSNLSQTGIDQAKKLSQKAKVWSIDIVASSHLNRAFDTAKICAELMNVDHIVKQGFAERHFGDWQGKAIASIPDFPDFRRTCYDNIKNKPNATGETTQAVRERFTGDLLQLVDEQCNAQSLLVVSHGDAIDCFISQWTYPQYLKNTEAVCVEFVEGRFSVTPLSQQNLSTTEV